jgi:hypothetical protein
LGLHNPLLFIACLVSLMIFANHCKAIEKDIHLRATGEEGGGTGGTRREM